MLLGWWAGLHGVVGAAALAAGLGFGAGAVLGGLLALHFVLRFPTAPPVVLCGDQSAWALPEHGLFGLSLAAGTRYTALWARLVLVDPAGAATRVLLLADQFERADWRKLQVALRECDTMDMGVVGRDPRSRAGR